MEKVRFKAFDAQVKMPTGKPQSIGNSSSPPSIMQLSKQGVSSSPVKENKSITVLPSKTATSKPSFTLPNVAAPSITSLPSYTPPKTQSTKPLSFKETAKTTTHPLSVPVQTVSSPSKNVMPQDKNTTKTNEQKNLVHEGVSPPKTIKPPFTNTVLPKHSTSNPLHTAKIQSRTEWNKPTRAQHSFDFPHVESYPILTISNL